MAKKQKQPQKKFSVKNYITTHMRSLPVEACYEGGQRETGTVNIIVVRKHPAGTFSFAAYLVDTYCCGVKDTYFHFSLSAAELEEILNLHREEMELKKIPYVEAHNLVYGAMEYAMDNGIEPAADFKVTQYFLDEDNDDIPLIEYDFGKDGKPLLVGYDKLEIDKYRRMMLKVLSPEDFEVVYIDPEQMYDDIEDDDIEGYDENLEVDYGSLNDSEKKMVLLLAKISEFNYLLPDMSDDKERYFHIVLPKLFLVVAGCNKKWSQYFDEYAKLNVDDDLSHMRKVAMEAFGKHNEYFGNCNPVSGGVTMEETQEALYGKFSFCILYEVVRERISALSDSEVAKYLKGKNKPAKFLSALIKQYNERFNDTVKQLDKQFAEIINNETSRQ